MDDEDVFLFDGCAGEDGEYLSPERGGVSLLIMEVGFPDGTSGTVNILGRAPKNMCNLEAAAKILRDELN
jgi:hypothetical protein